MKLGDFSSILQLGVGLHTGTVLLQSIVEFASAPITRRLERLARIAQLRSNNIDCDSSVENALDLQGDLETKKVQFFNEYKAAAKLNACVAFFLFILLAWAAVMYEFPVSIVGAALILLVSVAPAVISLFVLWWRWERNTETIRQKIDSLDRQLLGS
jgi:hypothetical protein